MQYLYLDGDDYYFMDTVSFEQTNITSEALGDSVNYLKPEMTIQVEFYGTEPVGIELPPTVDLKVVDTAPGINRRHRQRAGEAGHARNRPRGAGAAVRQQRRHDPRQHRHRASTCRAPDTDRQRHGRRPTAHAGLDRGHRRLHVQRQERGADPPAAPRPDCPPARPDLQADHRHALRRRSHRVAQRDAHPVAGRRHLAPAARAGGRRRRSGGHRRRAVLRPRAADGVQHAGGPRRPRDRGRASTRTTWASRSSRCRSCWRSPSTSPRPTPSAWSAATRPATPSGWWPAATACWWARTGLYEARCRGVLRSVPGRRARAHAPARSRGLRRPDAGRRRRGARSAGWLPGCRCSSASASLAPTCGWPGSCWRIAAGAGRRSWCGKPTSRASTASTSAWARCSARCWRWTSSCCAGRVGQLFGEVMMCAYYGYAFPMSTRIARGFYGDGVWSDSGFMPWTQISAVSWKEEPERHAGPRVPGAQHRPPPDGAGAALRTGAAPAARPHRRARHPHRRRRPGSGQSATSATPSEQLDAVTNPREAHEPRCRSRPVGPIGRIPGDARRPCCVACRRASRPGWRPWGSST